MMGPRQVEQGALFYNFPLDGHVPADHLLRSVDRFVDLTGLRRELAAFYSQTVCFAEPTAQNRTLLVNGRRGASDQPCPECCRRL